MIFHDISYFISQQLKKLVCFLTEIHTKRRCAEGGDLGTAQCAERLRFAHGTAGAKISDLGSARAPGHQGTGAPGTLSSAKDADK